ncbi:uncharacterized protein TM35_000202560 [Trypanosoma theileri]|uniref:Uncharacterized protein n=1 Tax=Trypanosoma theileri TaxID=67003 RepID=A0A1X0NT09_9TRYP|nr:uncharacterized protein TM35_000202560 [Trypanosoma theileri]ORC87847.1 hypothetical protein TM35_000202560 [Trypanosoma theileri]
MNSSKDDEQGGRPLPEWLRDGIAEGMCASPKCEPSTVSPKQKSSWALNGIQNTPEVLSLILDKLEEQSLHIEKMSAALAGLKYHTSFDVLTMVNVAVDAICEEAVIHVRSTVEYTDLIATVTLSFITGETSILLEETNNDVDFVGVRFLSNCVSGCHLLLKGGVYSVVVNMDTDKITDVTQLVLTAQNEESTRELYQALLSLYTHLGTGSGAVATAPPVEYRNSPSTGSRSSTRSLISRDRVSDARAPTMRRRCRPPRTVGEGVSCAEVPVNNTDGLHSHPSR